MKNYYVMAVCAIVALALLGAGYWYMQSWSTPVAPAAVTPESPMPDVNPSAATNPYQDIKTNPFD